MASLSLFARIAKLSGGHALTAQGLRTGVAAFWRAFESVAQARLEISAFTLKGGAIGDFSAYGSARYLLDGEAARITAPGRETWQDGKIAQLLLDYSITDAAYQGTTWALELGIHAGGELEDFSENELPTTTITVPISTMATPDKYQTVTVDLGDSVTFERGDRVTVRAARVAGGSLPAGAPLAILGLTLVHQAEGQPDSISEDVPPDAPDPDVDPDNPPAVPALNALTVGPERLTATLTAIIPGANYYEYDISLDSGFATILETRSSNQTSVVFTSLDYTNGVHYVRARAGNSTTGLISTSSNTVSDTPAQLAAPAAPAFSNVTESSIQVTFPTVSGALLYRIRVGSSMGGSEISDLSPETYINLTSPVISVPGLSDSTTYYFGCIASGVQDSPESTEASQATTAAAGSAITPVLVASTELGVAPLGVRFDLTASTSTDVTAGDEFHEIDIEHDYGDTVSANSYTYGNPLVAGRNKTYGPQGAHVYTVPGMYVYTATLRTRTGDITTVQKTITVQDPAVVFDGSNTICFSPSSNYEGAPPGASLAPWTGWSGVATALAQIGKRVLLHRGESFTSTQAVFPGGGCTIGAYGTGNAPVINALHGNSGSELFGLGVDNFRIRDVTIQGGSSAGNAWALVGTGDALRFYGGAGIVVHNCTIKQMSNIGINAFSGNQNNATRLRNVFVHSSTIENCRTSCVSGAFQESSFQGNWINGSFTGTVFRMGVSHKIIVEHNGFSGSASNTTPIVAFRGAKYDGTTPGAAWADWVSEFNQYIQFSDNKIIVAGLGGVASNQSQVPVMIKGSSAGVDERFRDFFIARNWWTGGSSSATEPENALHVQGHRGTILANIFDLNLWESGEAVRVVYQGSQAVVPSYIHILYNTVYAASQSSGDMDGFEVVDGDFTYFRGNIVFGPSGTDFIVDGGTNTVTSNNGDTGAVGDPTTDPTFASGTPGTNPADFAVASGSYAQDNGESLSVVTRRNFRDYLAALRDDTSPEQGAFEIGGVEVQPGEGDVLFNGSATMPSGVAPFGIVFDAGGVTSPYSTDHFRELDLEWDFDDTGAGEWGKGNQTSPFVRSRNSALGPWTAHVYETPGTYQPKLTVRAVKASDNSVVLFQHSFDDVVVTDPNVVYAGTNTICVSTSGDFSGKPTGAAEQTIAANNWTAVEALFETQNRRVLFRGGESWTHDAASGTLTRPASGSLFGRFGSSPTNPVFNCTQTLGAGFTPYNDTRFVDLTFRGQSGTPSWSTGGTVNGIDLVSRDYILMLRCTVEKFAGYGIIAYAGSQTSSKLSHVFIHDCVVQDNRQYNLFGSFKESSIQGCDFNTVDTEHVFRVNGFQEGVVSHNKYSKGAAGKDIVTMRALRWDGTEAGFWGTSQFSENFVFSDNEIVATPEGATEPQITALFTGSNNLSDFRMRQYIFERNFIHGSTGNASAQALFFEGPKTVVRNNALDVTNYSNPIGFICRARGAGSPQPSDAWIKHNTLYASAYAAGSSMNVVQNNGTSTIIQGNLAYLNTVSGALLDEQGSSTATDNTGDVGALGTSPGFTAQGTTDPLGYKTSGAGYGDDYARELRDSWNWRDFTGALRSTTAPDLGAFEA